MAEATPHILIVEDDRRTAALLELYLRDAGYAVSLEFDGERGLLAARAKRPDLVVLDLMLPECDGWTVCQRLRAETDVPILILSARQEEEDRLAGLALGADDYVVKPFSPREVAMRVRAILRRAGVAGNGAAVRLHAARRSAQAYGREVALTPSEFKLLQALTESQGRTLTRDDLLRRLYPGGGRVVTKVVDVHVSKLRQKIEPDPQEPRHIVTVRGFGYRFEAGARE